MLFRDATELKSKLASIQKNLSDATIMPFVQMVERTYIIPYIGQSLYDDLDTHHNTISFVANAAKDKAIDTLQWPIANFAYLEALPRLMLSTGDLGLQEKNTTNSLPARQWVVNANQRSAYSTGNIMMDLALDFLDKNIADYALYAAFEPYQKSKQLFINSTKAFNDRLFINNSRSTYLKLVAYIIRAEESHFLDLFGETLFYELKTQILNDNLTDVNKVLVEKTSFALAQLTILEGIGELPISIEGGGFRILGENDAINQSMAAPEKAISALAQSLQVKSQLFLNRLTKFLYDNIADYPLFEDSPIYVADEEEKKPYELPDNSNSESFWT